MVEPLTYRASWFAGDWLANRESADHAARSLDLTERLADWLRLATRGGQSQVVDLGCGSGSNMRYLAPRLPAGQSWLLVDHDDSHLVAAKRQCANLPGVDIFATRHGRIDVDIDSVIPEVTHVVSGSALLDLVSDQWMETLAVRVDALSAAAFFALSYSGDFTLSPMLEDDAWILQAVNQHQRSDKGSGSALGPDAWTRCAERFESRGYQVFTAPSSWLLGTSQRNLQLQLFEGWAEAAIEQHPGEAIRVNAWLARRIKLLDHAEAETRVCHQDVLALPGHSAEPGTAGSI